MVRSLKIHRVAVLAQRALIPSILSIIIITCVLDTSIIRLSSYIGGEAIWNVATYLIFVVIFGVGQYVILRYIKHKIEVSRFKPIGTLHQVTSILHWLIISLLAVISLQMIFTSSYSLLLLKIITMLSCGLSIFLLSFLCKNFFTWFKSSRDLVIASYGIAMSILIVNIFFMIVFIGDSLKYRPDDIKYTLNPVLAVTNAGNLFNSGYTLSSTISFILVWLATVFLLRYYSSKIGTTKYWIIVSAPLFYFLSQFQVTFLNLLKPFVQDDPTQFAIMFTLFFAMSKPVGGVLFGLAFWIVSRKVAKYAIKHYLMVSGFGMILLFSSNQSTSLILAPYPPFGLITASLLGLSSYLLLVGIYSSAMSVSRDTELRKFIYTVADREIKILSKIGFAQLEQELVSKVIPLAQQQAQKLEHETGVKSSITDTELKSYLEEILTEIRLDAQNNHKKDT